MKTQEFTVLTSVKTSSMNNDQSRVNTVVSRRSTGIFIVEIVSLVVDGYERHAARAEGGNACGQAYKTGRVAWLWEDSTEFCTK